MGKRQQQPGAPVRANRFGGGRSRETLGDLDFGRAGRSEYSDLVISLRDGSVQQRCGGGRRLIRKRTPE